VCVRTVTCNNAAYTLVDKTGCRAPFWRQLKGDVAYIEIAAHDSSDLIYVTAGTHGYFVNGVSTYDTTLYDSVDLSCSKKLTGSQLSLHHME